jgi:hypothetical protein
MRGSEIISNTAVTLSNRLFRKFARSFLVPVDFTRTIEIPRLLSLSQILFQPLEKPLRILDIGSPQLLSLSLASYSPNWQLTYINKFDEEINDLALKSQLLNLKNINLLQHDITKPMELLEDQFDYIFSCSVFEHILPEYGGDILAASIMERYLCRGGIFALSVPFYKSAFHEYSYTSVYDQENPANEKMFFQRFYDEATVNNQIINPSRLKLIRQSFIGERFWYPNNPRKRLANFISTYKLSFIFGRSFPLFAKIFFETSDNWMTIRKPYLSIVVLGK